jgi:hypothetical protein
MKDIYRGIQIDRWLWIIRGKTRYRSVQEIIMFDVVDGK